MITRENYEEFFLSYVDNELPAEARLDVERFAAAHPDLQEELETLMQCRLEPETDAVFPDKGSLLQYEESLLLYVDGELDEAGRLAVEKLATGDAGLRLDLERLKMTVSQSDPLIVFPDKESLYHRERRRVVMLPWFRVAAAAVVFGVAALLLLPHGHKTNVAIVTPAGQGAVKTGVAGSAATDSALAAAAPAKKTTSAVTLNDSPAFHSIKVIEETTQKKKAADAVAATKSQKVSADPLVTPAPVIAEVKPIADSSNATPVAATLQTHPDKAAVNAIAAVNIPKEQRSFATQALLQEAQQDGNGDMADNAPPATGKTKLRGLFRRVTRAFGKTADRDDDGQRQVSISVFQVALK